MSVVVVIERYMEPLAGNRGQLHQAVFFDGAPVPELSHKCGSPAPAETVRKYEQTIVLGEEEQ